MNALALLVLLLSTLCWPCLASTGDEAPEYRGCLYHCVEGTGRRDQVHSALCEHDAGAAAARRGGAASAIALRWAAWSCEADCGYLCMWAVEGARSESRPGRSETPRSARKYHGKWPFTRLLGAQEPLSCAASLLNAAAHALALRGLRRAGRGGVVPYLAHCLLSTAAWLASAAFHARDTRATERADYFLAGAVMVLGLHVTALRTLRPVRARRGARAGLAAALGFAYAARVHAMLARRFDYGGWVAACLALGLVQTLLWLRWAWRTQEGAAHPGRRPLCLFVATLNAASVLEVFDFPPLLWHSLDAHAAWHLATVPLWAMWYCFVLLDLKDGRTAALLAHASAAGNKEL